MSKKNIGSIIKNTYLHPFRYDIANRQEFWWCEVALFFSLLVIFVPMDIASIYVYQRIRRG